MNLTEYLSQLDGQYRIYDVGRRIRKLDKQLFLQFETLNTQYPYPYLQHAWLALYISQPKQPENETLWFLKWPLDEQGNVVPAVRDDLVQRFLALSQTPLKADSEIEDPLKDNPFSFNPDDVRRASLHAIVQASARRKPSSHFDTVINYLKAGNMNPLSFNHWQEIGFQGLADLSARALDHLTLIKASLPLLPAEPYLALAQSLEHQSIPFDLGEIALKRLLQDLTLEDNTSAVEAGMRIVGACQADTLRIEAWKQWINSIYSSEVATLLAFATRNFDDLAFTPELIPVFLERLANLDNDFSAFKKIMSDLLFLPGTRNLYLSALRAPDRAEILGHAMQALLQDIQSR